MNMLKLYKFNLKSLIVIIKKDSLKIWWIDRRMYQFITSIFENNYNLKSQDERHNSPLYKFMKKNADVIQNAKKMA